MKFLRYIQKKRRAMFALAAFTLFASPFTAQASNITTKAGVTLKPTNNVYNIAVQKTLDSVGVNKFKDFSLDKGHIANIQFNNLKTVANLVDNKISINGTVNALRDGKIGGNLYFLSPNGIAVGASGVINAGSFTGMAVSKDYFDKLSDMDDATKFTNALKPENIEYNNDPKKGIDIQGVINAPGGISLYATKIDIGNGAKLHTDVKGIDFKKVVNIDSVDSGITGGLDASYKDGDIILKAYAEQVLDDSKLDKITDEDAAKWDKISEREATINVDGTLKSAKDLKINAESVITFKEGEKFNAITQTQSVNNFLKDYKLDWSINYASKTNKATVNIKENADLQSKGDMDISATANLTASIKTITPDKSLGNNVVPATAVGVIVADNQAVVNVEGKLKSEGTMAIKANTETSLTVDAKTKTILDSNDDKFFIGVGVITGSSNAEVNIKPKSTITASGSDSSDAKAFEAVATSKNTISNSASAASKEKSTVNTAVNVTSYTSDATVNVDSDITAEKGSINIDATNTTSNTNVTSNVFGTSVAPFKNPFILNPNSSNSSEADKAKKVEEGATKATNNALEKAINTLKDKTNQNDSSGDSSAAPTAGDSNNSATVPESAGGSTFSKVLDGSYFKAGVAVGVFSQTNNAKVNVVKDVKLIANKDVTLNAKSAITRQKLSVESTVNNQTDKQSTATMIGLGVLVSDIDNNADVIVDGSLTAQNGNVKITSDSGMNYNQFEALVKDLTDQFDKIKEDAEELGDTVKEKFEGYKKEVTDVFDKASDDPAEFMSNLSTLSETVKNVTADIKKINLNTIQKTQLKKDIDALPSKLTAFLRPVSYSNYYARSAFADTQTADSTSSTKLDAAGSFSIDTMVNNSRIMLKSGSNINAEKGTVEVDSAAKGRVVAITGMGGEYLQSSTASNRGVGVSVMIGKFDNNALVTVGKSELKGNDIKIKSDDYSKHVNLIYGNGKADSTTITGMVSYIKSPTDSIISIDDSAKLNASNNINLEASGEDYITSVNGAITLGNGGGKSFGAAINVLSNDKNTAVIVGDNGKVSDLDSKIETLEDAIEAESDKDNPDADKIISNKSDLKFLKITKRTQDILGEELLKNLDASAVNADGVINAKNLTVKADNTGTINAIAIEGTENSDSHGLADAFNKNVTRGQTAINYSNDAFKAMPNMLINVFNSKKKTDDKDAAPPVLNKSGKDTPTNAQNDANTNAGGNESPAPPVNTENASSKLNVAGAGSGAINITGGETGSFISNANITAENVDVSANDDVFHGSWAGAGAFNFFGNSQAAKNTNVAIGGSVAYTDTNQNVGSIIRNSTINNAKSIKNTAMRDDSDVSAGLGLAVSTNSGNQGTNVDVGISASINFIEGDTHALLLNNTVKGSAIENKATLDSLQVAGGVDIALSTGGNSGVNIGGSGVASKINNDLQSGILKGSYQNLGNVDINANKKTNQIDAAVGGGATFGSNTKGFAFGGAVAVADITNSSRAFLNGTTAFESTGNVNVDALDTKNSGKRSEYLSSRSVNTDPTSFLSDSPDYDDKSKVQLDGGNSIVNVALGIGGSTGESGAGSIGVSYAGIANLMNVDINGNTLITAKNLKANINANKTGKNNVVNVTIGFAGSNKSFAGAGAAGVTDIKNDAVINANSNINADSFLSAANSSTHIVNVAGQAALSDEFSGGLTFAYNAMNNNTASNVNGGTLNVNNLSSTATNDNYALAIGAGGTYSNSTGAINGAVGLNMGDNSTKAIVNNATINNVNALNVIATDNTSKTTVAGDVNISNKGKIALGGAVAYANIGDSDDKEILNAKITKSTITTNNNAAIDVKTADNASMTTVGVGVGLAISGAYGSFNGAAAVSEVNKENVAEISNTAIDEDKSTGNANVTINAASGKNTPDKLTFKTYDDNGKEKKSSTDVDNKINTAAAVLDLNFSSNSILNGAVAVAVNKFNQSTEANFKHDSISDKVSNVGNVSMNSNSNADILGVAIGGAGGKSTLSAAGSVSYNYIDNSAKTLVENENVKAGKNFGVVAQSDDLLANYAGALDIDVGGRGSIGVSVAYNEIKGNADAKVSSSKLKVSSSDSDLKVSSSKLKVSSSDSDLIAISNPKDNLIDGYVTKNTWTSSGLMSGRATENKSGVVVNSSATHSISSDLATIGVRLSKNFGVGISGTVNINKIGGATNAKVEKTDVDGNADTFVNAADYTNNGSFVGNAAVSGSVAVGILWNENQVKRETNALVNGGTLNVKNLDVKADSRQGLSNLNIAVGAAFSTSSEQGFAAASGDNIVRNQMESTTTAKIENATVNHSGAVDVNAYHKDNAFATNIAVGAAIDTSSAGATFDMGYGLMRENSTVEAEINNSTLSSEEKGAVNVNAENSSKIAGAFGTLGVAVHAGDAGAAASVALGINNNYITDTVHAGIKGSTLDVGKVDVNAKNTSEIKADGGVAAVAASISESFFASLGAAVAVTNATFDNEVTADVDSSIINAAGDVNINARDDHKSDETVVSAAMSTGLAVSVNRMSTSINSGLANLKADQLGKPLSSKDLVMKSNNASKSNADSDSDKLNREFGSETRFINNDSINDLVNGIHTDSVSTKNNIKTTLKERYQATVNSNNSLEKGVFANVQNSSTINAGDNKISINSTENNDLSITSGSGNAGIIGIGVGSTTIETRRANTAKVVGSSLNAKNIDISTTNAQIGESGIISKMYNATLASIGVSVGYNNVETNGSGEILISDSNITAAENINAKAIDNSKSKSYILDAGLKIYGYTGVFAYNTNTSQTGIEVSNKSALSANAINLDTQNHTHRATDTLAISAGTLGIQTNTSEAKDTSTNFINVKGSDNIFTADNVNLNALNGSQTYAYSNGQGYGGLEVIVLDGLANNNNSATISIDDGSTFKATPSTDGTIKANSINITAQIGEDGKKSAMAEGFGLSVSGVGVNVDNMTAKTETTAKVNIGNEFYGNATTLNVNALNKASRDSFMRNNAYALVANANDISAYTIAKDKASVTVGSNTALDEANKLTALNITSDSANKSYVAAKGTGGAIGGEFGSAAHADNSADNSSEVTLNGSWNISDALTLNANQHDSAYISGYSARGAILTGGKGSLDNEIKGTSTATISDGAIINAKTINVNAKNYIKTDKYSDDYDYTLFGRMGGVVDDVDYQRSTATTNKSANINIGKNATITTTGKQNYDALNDYNLTNKVYAEGGSLLASLRWVKSHNYITTNENISVGTGANVKNEGGTYEDGGITMAAHDNLELAPTARGESDAGAGGYVRAETLIELNRNPKVTIDGTVKSAKDLNLYAGADINGDRARVHSYAQAVSLVHTLVTDGSADIIRKGANNATINLTSGAYGQATHDINIISNAGFEVYEEMAFYGSTWSSDGGYKVVTSDKGDVATSEYKHNNKVIVDGELKAASTPDATVKLSGIALPDDFILTNSKVKPLSYSVTSGKVTITKYNDDFTGKSSEEIFAQQIYNGISTDNKDYDDYLTERYETVCKTLSDYHVEGKEDLAAYAGLNQEKEALEQEMVKLGMGDYVDRVEDGKVVGKEFLKGASKSIEIKTVVLPDIEVSGGNINVSTGDFTGKGKLNASGIPKIDIQNDSSAYLITNRLTIADKGGAINYNEQAVASNSAINNVNVSKTGANFSDLQTASVTEVPTISVTNSYAGSGSIPMKPDPKAEGYNTLEEDAKNATLQYTPINYIEVTKDINNPVGNVILSNKQGSIRILAGANVNGMSIEMTAKDSISQGYTDGIVNIAYTPESKYAKDVAALRADVGWDKSMPTSDQSITKTYDKMATSGKGRIAGDAIYIAARDINVNGLIQAGYNGYKVKITQADLDNATEAVFFNGVTMYKVNSGGEKDDGNGYKYYEPQVYYDKDNDTLYVEDINSTGGKVYLAGRISSTGNGKIVVADGTGDIDIQNSTTSDMKIGNVTSTGGDAIIQIIDTEQDKLTEYSSDRTRTIENYSAWLVNHNSDNVKTQDGLNSGATVQYKPKSGLTYNWTEGTRQEETYHYSFTEELSWWGLASNYSGNLAAMSTSWTDKKAPEKLTIGNGVYISDDTATSGYITMLAQNVVTGNSYGNYKVDGPYKHGFLNFYRDYIHRWTKTTGTKQIYQYAVKADYPISVGLIGKGEPTINLFNNSTLGGDLYLAGNIRNDNATLNIKAQGGDIIQEGVTVATDNINLSARNHIKNIDITNHRTDALNLNAQSTSNAGNIDINVQGGMRDNQYLNGSVVVNDLSSKNGEISLTAQGNIRQDTDAASINARNIKLESQNGYINLKLESDGRASLANNVSAISAAAKGDITLVKNDNADFRIGSIVSTTGDVTLTAKGKFIDALDKKRDNAEADANDLVKSWIDMGLIAGTDDYKGAYVTKLEQDRDAYKSDVTAQFKEYGDLLLAYEKQLAEYNAIEDKSILAVHQGVKDASKVTEPTMSERLTLLNKKFANYETADEYLAADKDYQTLVATAANPHYQWTQDDLLNGIRSALVNKEEGSDHDTTRPKDANITARNVTLTGAGVGTNSKEVTTIKMSEITRQDKETAEQKTARLNALTKLANAEAADITVHFVLGDDGEPVTHKIERVNYRYDADNGYYIAGDNYIRYRNDADGNLMKYTYTKDAKNKFKQVGDAVAVAKDKNGNYDFSDVIESTMVMETKEIESFDIKGTIPLGINATGNITVKTTGNEGNYIAGRNKGVKIDTTTNPNTDDYSALNIVSVETTKADGNYGDVRIIGEKGIFNANTDASAANVIGKDLVLVGGNGAIGTQDKPLNIQLTGDLLDARANDEINLQKVGKDDLRVSAVYSPKAIRIANNDKGIIRRSTRFDEISEAYLNSKNGEITLTGNVGMFSDPIEILPHDNTILNLKGGGDFYIKGIDDTAKATTGGTITLNNISGNIDINSTGSIKQTADGENTLTSLKIGAKGDILLTGNNKLSTLTVDTVGGDFELNNDSDKVTVTFNDKVTGGIKVTQRNEIELAGSIEAKSIDMTSKEGSLKSIGGLKTKLTAESSISLSATDLVHEGEVITDKLTLATDADAIFTNTENTFSELTVSSRDDKAINGSVNVTTKAGTYNANVNSDVSGDLILTNAHNNGGLNLGGKDAINVGGKFTLETAGDINYGSTVSAGKDVTIKSRNLYRKPQTSGYFSTPENMTLNISKEIGAEDSPILIGNTENSLGLNILSGGGYIRGVNSGALWLGNIATDKVLNIASEDSIAQGTGKKISVRNIDIAVANAITLDNAGNEITKLVLNSLSEKNTGSVSVNSEAQNGLTIEGDLSTAGSVAIKSNRALTLNNELEADKTIDLTAGGNITSGKASVINAGEQITMTGNNLTFNGEVATPKVVATTKKGLDMQNADNAIDALEVGSGTTSNISGSVLVTTNAEEFIPHFKNDVANDITLVNKQSKGVIALQNDNNEYLRSTKGNITLDMDGLFMRGRPLWARKDVNITVRNGMIFIMNFSSETNNDTLHSLNGSVNLNSNAGVIVEGRISAGNDVVAKADDNGIIIYGDASIDAGKNIELTSDADGIAIAGTLTSSKGDIKMKVGTGDVDILGSTSTNTPAVNAKNGGIDINVTKGNITIGEDTPEKLTVSAKGDIDIKTQNGVVTISGKTKSSSGNIKITTNRVTTSANVAEIYPTEVEPISFAAYSDETPALEVNLFADTAETDSYEVTPKTPGDITINAELEADHSVEIVTDDGDIEITKKITVTNGDITIATQGGDIKIDTNGADDMVSAQNDLTIQTDDGAIDIAGKVSTQDGDITIKSNQTSYTTGQAGITVESTGAINPAKNVNMNVSNGDINFGSVSAQNVNINSSRGDVTANTIKADDTISIALERGNLYLNLAQSKGVAIVANDSTNSTVNTIRADSVDVDDAVKVGRTISYRDVPRNYSSGSSSSGGSGGSSNPSSFLIPTSSFLIDRTGYSNFASNPSSFATLGTTYTNNGLTYWQNATTTPTYFLTPNFYDDRQTRNYFEVKFVPTWLEKEFLSIDFDYSFDNFGIKNATEDELTIN